MRAGVQQDARVRLHALDRREHALEVEAARLRLVVRVALNLEKHGERV